MIIAGNDPASRIYVRNKAKACAETGIYSEIHEFSENVSQDEVIRRIQELNENLRINGILVQLPLPPHFENDKVFASIAVEKDVDGFHPYNVGALATGNAIFPPCTPHGVMHMLEKYGIPVEGQHAVVVGRSNIVGKPMALMLLQKSATVTICTSKTRDLAEHTRRADILVVAAGKPRMISAAMIKAGAAVIDVGINRLPDGKSHGRRRLRFRQGESRIHYPCSGRGRADDNYHVTLQHHRGRGTRSNTALAAMLQANGRSRHVYNIPRI